MSDQIPPADRLAQVRAMLKVFGDEESQLKALMLNDPSARTGNQHVVELHEVETSRTDIREMRACHPAIVEQFTFKVKTTRVELRGISEDGEIVRIKRGQAA
jgi:aspartate carbamoyltransferase regulatory subunit